MFLWFVVIQLRHAQAKAEAARIVEEATEHSKELEEAAKLRAEQFATQMLERAENENERVEQKIEQLENKIKDREEKLEENLHNVQKVVSEIQSKVDIHENQISHLDRRVQNRRQTARSLLDNFVAKIEQKLETSRTETMKALQERALADKKVEVTRDMQRLDEEASSLVEIEAKKLLNLAINRFIRPYCPERGIGYLNFESEEQKTRVLGPNQDHLRYVEKICGVDLAYDEQNNAVSVYGFDPVRRELGRATVDKMMSERQIDQKKIDQIAAKAKKDLFQKIVNDGNRITKELRLQNVNPEIKNMMGALRYRYSFTQNQFFHCSEVGFLCGLLGSELGVPLLDARRAGMLHDIGKAMDHSVDGGHAVIGADFIKQHGEADHIIHAVRAHHFDETPNTDLAYLVIAADAISGARPGARRSTAATYTQKIEDLHAIARGFDGVTDTHVLSAGREIRVYVDGRRHDDLSAMKISQEIATKIENEMQYPGQIRVTVVRETQAIEYAR
jgi:ribonuclease Y